MGASRYQFSEVEQGRPQLLVGLLQAHRILQTLGEGETLLCQLTRHLETRARQMQPPQARHHRETLWAVSHLLAEGVRPGVGVFHFWGDLTLDHRQR